MNPTEAALGQEWSILQNNFEGYETSCLFIKLTSIVLFTSAMAANLPFHVLGIVMTLLWLQEGILRTCQSRLGARILCVEGGLRPGNLAPAAAFQLHSDWQAARPGAGALLIEYAASACRPTVAFPHAILVLVAVMSMARG